MNQDPSNALAIWDRPIWRDPANGPERFRGLKDLNSALIREDLDRRNPWFRGLPEVVMLNHTDICNLRCVMCPRHDTPGQTRIPRPVLEVVARRLFPAARKLGLAAAYAEPMATDFEFLIDLADRFGVRVDMTTNATLLTIDRYRAARRVLDHLDISIDSHVPETYESIRLGARFACVRDNVMAIRDERARIPDDVIVTISAVVMNSNLLDLPGLVRAAKDMGAVALILKDLNRTTKTAADEDPCVHHGWEKVSSVLMECRRTALDHGMNLLRLSRCAEVDQAISVNPLPTRFPIRPSLEPKDLCWYLAQNFHILQTGEVYPCLMPTTYSAGNVLAEDPIDIWNGPVLRRLRSAHFARRGIAFCSGCAHAPHLPPPGIQTQFARKAAIWTRRLADVSRTLKSRR